MDIEEATVKITFAVGGSARPDEKTRRYDRQLRLWGGNGQAGLESARLLCIGANGTATQSLKNLILPGIGSYTLLSPLLTTEADVGQNFFLTPSSIGKPLAQETASYLAELNPAVKSFFEIADIKDVLKERSDWILGFTMILCIGQPADVENELSAQIWNASATAGLDIPVIFAHTSGFTSTVRLLVREHTILNPHPATTALSTLHLTDPFPLLKQHSLEMNLTSMNSMDHGNVPWVVLMVRAVEAWKNSHGGKLPIWSGRNSDKKEFQAVLLQEKLAPHADEENFDELFEKGYMGSQAYKIPSEIQRLFDDNACINANKDSKPFWLLLSALRLFASRTARLPISATLPDMKSSTTSYVALQNIYKAASREDLEAVKSCLTEIGAGEIEGLEDGVKMAAHLNVVRGRSLAEEMDTSNPVWSGLFEPLKYYPPLHDEEDEEELPTPPPPLIGTYIAHVGSQLFYASQRRRPGFPLGVNVRGDEVLVEEECLSWMTSRGWNSGDGLPDAVKTAIGELVRAGGSDIPTTAAFVGGIVAQEAIKILTAQYIPLDNTCIIDLIRGTTEVFRL